MLTIEGNRGYEQRSTIEDLQGQMPGIMHDSFMEQNWLSADFNEKLADIIGKERGFFVEIGAGDGIEKSKTHFLENHGWQGILIESDIELCARCTINRPKSAVLNYNCVLDDQSEKNTKYVNTRNENSREVKINRRALPSILDEFQVEVIDLLVINKDEEQSLSILKGMDIFHYRIENILIMETQSKVLAYLENAGCDPFELKDANPYVNYVLCRFVESKPDIAEKYFSERHDFYMLERAWDIAARSNASYPGKYVAYYSLDIEGRHYAGERPWEERWEYIGSALREACGGDLTGKRILELGCNLGLLSVWAAREGAFCSGYEYEADILEGARLLASSFGVSERCKWSQADFNKKEVTDSIVGEYDICTCLSVMNWVMNKDNFIEFLSRQKKVIYEGHDSDQIETGRLRKAGFSDIKRLAVSERGRGVFFAAKNRGVAVKDNKDDILTRAWDIAARSNASYPGKYVAYYSLDIEGRHYAGERPWEERWEYIGSALREACGGDLTGKRILELGCNLGLLSVWAAREGAFCIGYEYEADILEGARLLASSFGVSERCKWSQADFNKKEVTDSIVGEYDICTCLSVMNWVRNKDNLIEFLSRQKKVIYEGHDNDQVERERLARAGFTDIEKIVSSERKRSVFIARKDIQTEKRITWENFEKRYGLKGVSFETPNVNTGDGNRVERIYFKNSEVWKVRLSAEKNPAKLASPYEEARFLQLLKDVPNICRFKSYLETTFFTVVILEYFPNIGTLDQVSIPPEYYNKVENQKHEVVKAVNERGILHNDILDRNFLVNSDYDICLIDFDQAQLISGLNDYEHGRYSRFSKPVVYHTAGDDKTGNLKKLEEAWDVAAKSNATSPGRYLAYYSLNADGRFLHGEIPWADRWKEIEKPLLEACNGDFNGKNIIELGCNMGLVSIWAAKNGAQCHGYDRYGDILEACKLNASAFGVSDRCKWDVIDFNNEAECKTISLDYDVCICLSLMKWVKQKPNLLGLLSRQKKLVYEGHDGNEVERDRLKGAGFSDIREIGISSRGRTIFLATRNTGSGLKYEKAEMLSKAWDIAARSNASYPGKYIAYYSLDVEGRRFPGERPWEERWKYIGKALREACGGDLNGKKILELGCNLGLLSVWAAREGAFCSGCEYEADILEGARLLASSFGVSERCKWSQADFNKKEVTDSIDGEYDICTCLSVMNWVRSKDNLIEFLSRQKKVIYEGHDSDQIETVRLRKAGFSEIERVAVSERGRGVFLARKTI